MEALQIKDVYDDRYTKEVCNECGEEYFEDIDDECHVGCKIDAIPYDLEDYRDDCAWPDWDYLEKRCLLESTESS